MPLERSDSYTTVQVDQDIVFCAKQSDIPNLPLRYRVVLDKYAIPLDSIIILNRIFVANAGDDADRNAVCKPFKKYGKIVAFKKVNANEHVARSYAFITFSNPNSACCALSDVKRFKVNNRRVTIRPAFQSSPIANYPPNPYFRNSYRVSNVTRTLHANLSTEYSGRRISRVNFFTPNVTESWYRGISEYPNKRQTDRSPAEARSANDETHEDNEVAPIDSVAGNNGLRMSSQPETSSNELLLNTKPLDVPIYPFNFRFLDNCFNRPSRLGIYSPLRTTMNDTRDRWGLPEHLNTTNTFSTETLRVLINAINCVQRRNQLGIRRAPADDKPLRSNILQIHSINDEIKTVESLNNGVNDDRAMEGKNTEYVKENIDH
ncbi:hypothetical protein ACOME3_001879 [Neoechinorhynchus agilis]